MLCSCYSNFHNKLCEVKCDEDDQTLALCRVRQIPVELDHGLVEAAKSLRKKIQVWKLFYFLDNPLFNHCKIWKQLLVSSGRCYAPPPSSPPLSLGVGYLFGHLVVVFVCCTNQSTTAREEGCVRGKRGRRYGNRGLFFTNNLKPR